MIGKIAYSLNQSADLDGLQIAEALWLSRFLTLSEPETTGEQKAETAEPGAQPATSNQTPATADPFMRPAQTPERSPSSVYAGTHERQATGAGAVAASKIRAPGVAALAGALEISRALRPFARRIESHHRQTLDEAATVELSAELSRKARPIILPVLKPARERWFEVAVVVEDTPSMAVWRSTVAELVLLLGNHGAFRDVRLWRLAFADDAPRLYSKSGAELETKAVNDVSSRRLMLLVSDCVSPRWRDGGMARLIANWSATMPVVIGQMLGQRLWRRTALGEPTAEVKTTRPGASNKDLTVTKVKWWDRAEARSDDSDAAPASPAPDGNRIACPVISLDPKPIASWARMLFRPGRRHPAVLLSLDALPLPVKPAAHAEKPASPIPAETRLERYRMMVSPEAYRLAINLSFLPLTLPVMRVAQRAAMPDTGHDALSEFLLGGLLKRKDPAATQTDHDLVQYDFHEGVRDLLRSELQPEEVRKLLPCISDFIGRRVHGIYDFIAWAVDAQGEHQVQPDDLPFAEIGLDGLEQMGYPRRTIIKEVSTSDMPTSKTPHQTDASPSAGSGAIAIGKIQVLSGGPGMLDTALQGKLGFAEAAQFANRLCEMTAVEVTGMMREAGIERLGERLRLMMGGAEIGAYLANDATREIYELLLEADRRCQVVKSPQDIENMVQLYAANYELDQEILDTKSLVRETANASSSGHIFLATSNKRHASLQTALDLYAEFPDGVLIVKSKNERSSQYELMLACVNPFVKLGVVLTVRDQILLISQWLKVFRGKRALIIVDQVRDPSEMLSLSQLPQGNVLIVLGLLKKVRIYDLAKELKIESRKILEDARRLGADVSVPSNVINDDIAYRIRQLYFLKEQSRVARQSARLIKGTELKTQVFGFRTLTLDGNGNRTQYNDRVAHQFTELVGELRIEMVEIPGGTFKMGSPESEAERWDHETQHEVTVSPFYIGKFTITQAQWRTVAGWPKVERDLEPEPSRFKDKPDSDLRPVEQVSWEDAKEFCARLSQKTGRAYRLPTEAEWEYACRAGTTTPFAFGETITHEIANYNSEYPYAKAKKQKSRGETVPVGSLSSTTAPVANAFGLYDVHGNVWEWCEDWYGDYPSEPQTDPTGPETGQYRVLRGGSWFNVCGLCRSAVRYDDGPLVRGIDFGFRVVCVSARTS